MAMDIELQKVVATEGFATARLYLILIGIAAALVPIVTVLVSPF